MNFTISKNPPDTEEWLIDKLGKFSASTADKQVTKTGKLSTQITQLINEKIGEVITGESPDFFKSDAMLRGQQLEPQALEFVNFTYGFNFKKTGFLLHNSGGYGCSPDGLDLDHRVGLELKCPLAHTQVGYLTTETLPDKYKAQVQFSLMVSGFEKWIFCSYHPSFPCYFVEVYRDEPFIALLEKSTLDAVAKVNRGVELIKQKIGA